MDGRWEVLDDCVGLVRGELGWRRDENLLMLRSSGIWGRRCDWK
jgi:hypothetical protein